MRDVLTDVTASQVAFCGGHAHLGFVKCAAFVEREAAAHLEAVATSGMMPSDPVALLKTRPQGRSGCRRTLPQGYVT